MIKKIVFCAFVLCAFSCASEVQREKVPAINMSNLDTTAVAQDDFYAFTTGGWKALNPLKDEFARYGNFDVLREQNEQRVKVLFADLSKKKNKIGSVGQKIVDLYNMGMDSLMLNAQGLSGIEEELNVLLSGDYNLSEVLATLHLEVANPLFGLFVETDIKNSDRRILYAWQSGLSMGTREYYLEDRYEELREDYEDYIEDIFKLAKSTEGEAKRIANSVMQVEMALAEASRSNVELRDTYANYNVVSIDEFKKSLDAIDWDVYSQKFEFTLPDSICVGQPEFIETVNNLLKTFDLQVIKDYLAYNFLGATTSYLSDELNDLSFDFYGTKMTGQQEKRARWKRALAVPNGVLGEAVGEMYVEKYFPAEYKVKMLDLVENLRHSLSTHIDQLEWMGEQTKQKAQEKLEAMNVKIGYPDKWEDYTELIIDPALSYWENIRAISRWATKKNFSELNEPVDREDWFTTPQTVNAFYNPTTNEICFPAAILQPPFFNPDADDAVNYGAIGVVIGHEMTHGFDDQGREFDKVGNLSNWWSDEDAEAFDAKAQILAEQFDKIEVLPGLFANGSFTLGENIADQGGLRVAYTAMKQAQRGVEPEPIDGFTADQRFYISYASIWAQNIRDEEVERLTNTDPHSLCEWRVNQTLKNIDTFYETFGIQSDDDMYLEPAQRVVIW